jgi:hypothetical protein
MSNEPSNYQPFQGGGYPPQSGNTMNYALWADRALAALIDGAIALRVCWDVPRAASGFFSLRLPTSWPDFTTRCIW